MVIMAKAYFISDLHIGAETGEAEERKQKRFLEFLSDIEKSVTDLYIVGDLFDFWFEYRQVIPKKYFVFLHRFKQLTDKGVKIYYLAGNHDFALGTFFDSQLGIKTFLNTYEFTLAEKRFFLYHGDGVAKNDGGYRLLKKILRSGWNQKIFRWIHPDVGIRLALSVSGSSRKYTNQKNGERDESDYKEFAQLKFNDGFDYVIMGHRHNPLTYETPNGLYINLGDWIVNYSFAVFDGQSLQLKFFK
ncbi:MAG: UDP-2,3-diacylglucosamine diphosphatase [Caldithrix sp.]|nr:UDP-2,3-diacylglucosamine diphosphatase [Caldithrix sp.]